MVRSIVRAVVVGSVIAAALLVAPSVLAAERAVSIQGFAFSPEAITVAVGDTVTWTNGDATNHTATADDGTFNTGTIADGASKSVTFATTGTFAYHCAIQRSMTGSVIVEAAAAPPATDTFTPAATPRADSAVGVLLVAAVGGLVIGLVIGRRAIVRPVRSAETRSSE